MKSDLDDLIQEAGLEAIMVLGDTTHNAPMYYLVGGGHVNRAVLIKKPHSPSVLYCNAMEREEAAKSGLEVIPLTVGGVDALLADPREILTARGVTTGRVGLYGTLDIGDLLAVRAKICAAFPDLEIVGEPKDESIFLRAMETKDGQEVERIRRMGKITTEVVWAVRNLLTSSAVRDDEVLLQESGKPLTITDVKSRISLWLAERGATEVEGTIFAIGRDAGLPHSIGTPGDPIRLGQTIVFDIFPAEAQGGYYYDFTRTWSLGYAAPEAQRLYDEVQAVYEKVIDNIDLNADFRGYQKLTSDEFHKNGHATPLHNPGVLESGYVHSLGHGVGLNVHERPWSRHTAGDDNILRPGVVITIEPGLYYPEKGMGVRIEDTYWVKPGGGLERLAEFPYDFVLEMAKWKPG